MSRTMMLLQFINEHYDEWSSLLPQVNYSSSINSLILNGTYKVGVNTNNTGVVVYTGTEVNNESIILAYDFTNL